MNKKVSSWLDYLTTKTFLKHLLLSVLTVIAILIGTLQYLKSFTEHDQTIEVPNFIGIKTTNLPNFIANKEVRFQIVDSIYDEHKPKGTVVEQTPQANFKVKRNRTIYLIVNAVLPAQVKMPNLKDVSLRQATAILTSCGLKLGKLTYIPDIAQNAVLKQIYKGQTIAAGTFIPRGSTIDLVLGQGLSDEEVEIPDLIGLTRKEAIEAINLSFLTVGAELFDSNVKDSSMVWVYNQRPEAKGNNKIKSGSSIDLFYTNNQDKINQIIESKNNLNNDTDNDE
jgi:beta-lactam-binding protein with PASTA domain